MCRKPKMRKGLTLLVALVPFLLIAGNISPVSGQEVKVGILAIIPEVGIYVAQEKGFFKEQGLETKLERFRSQADQVPMLSGGHLDVGTGGLTAVLFNAFAREIPLLMVAELVYIPTREDPKPDLSAIVVRQDLIDAGAYKGFSDLKGMPIAVLGPQNPSVIYLERTLARGGLKLSDVELVYLPPTDVIPALKAKRVSAAFIMHPFLALGLGEKLIQVIASGKDYYPGHIANILVYSPKFAKNQEVARRFMVAFLKGQRWYYEAAFKDKNKEELYPILEKHTPLKGPLLRRLPPVAVNPNGGREPRVWKEIFGQDQDYWARKGFIPKPVDIDKMIDLSFLEYAIKQLGVYKD